MSLENAISDHAAAIRELAAAILAQAGSPAHAAAYETAEHNKAMNKLADVKVVDKKDAKPDAKKDTTAAKPAAATGKPGATPPANKGASSIDYATIKAKILEFAKQPEGREKLTALLQRFGVAKGPDLTAEQHEQFDADITRALAGEFDPRDAEEHAEVEDDASDMA